MKECCGVLTLVCLIISCSGGRQVNVDSNPKNGVYKYIDELNGTIEYVELKDDLRNGFNTLYKEGQIRTFSYFESDTLRLKCEYLQDSLDVVNGSPYLNCLQNLDTLFLGDTLWLNLYHVPLPQTLLYFQKENEENIINEWFVHESKSAPLVFYEVADTLGYFERYWYVSVVDSLNINRSFFDYKFRIDYLVQDGENR